MGAATFSDPRGSASSPRARRSAPSMSSNTCRQLSRKISPRSVSRTVRVVRLRRMSPSLSSRSATERVTTEGDSRSCLAASVKLPREATVTNTAHGFKSVHTLLHARQ